MQLSRRRVLPLTFVYFSCSSLQKATDMPVKCDVRRLGTLSHGARCTEG